MYKRQELAYIDTATPAVDVEHYGTLLEHFVPAIVHELAARNTRVFDRIFLHLRCPYGVFSLLGP